MKKIIFLLTIVFLTTTAFLVQEDRTTLVLGKWKVADENINGFVAAQIENTRKQSPERAEQMEQNLDMMQQMVTTKKRNFTKNARHLNHSYEIFLGSRYPDYGNAIKKIGKQCLKKP